MSKKLVAVTALSTIVAVLLVLAMWMLTLAQPSKQEAIKELCQKWDECIWFNRNSPDYVRKWVLKVTDYFGLESDAGPASNNLSYADPLTLGKNAWESLDEKLLDDLDAACNLSNEARYIEANGHPYIVSFGNGRSFPYVDGMRICDVEAKQVLPVSLGSKAQRETIDILDPSAGQTMAVVGHQGAVSGFVTLERKGLNADGKKCIFSTTNYSFEQSTMLTMSSNFERQCITTASVELSGFPELKNEWLSLDEKAKIGKFIDLERMGSADMALIERIASHGKIGKAILAKTLSDKFTYTEPIKNVNEARNFSYFLEGWISYLTVLQPYINFPENYNAASVDVARDSFRKALTSVPSETDLKKTEELLEMVNSYGVIGTNVATEYWSEAPFAYYGFSGGFPVLVLADQKFDFVKGMYRSFEGYSVGSFDGTYEGRTVMITKIKPLTKDDYKSIRQFKSAKEDKARLIANAAEVSKWLQKINMEFVQANAPAVSQP